MVFLAGMSNDFFWETLVVEKEHLAVVWVDYFPVKYLLIISRNPWSDNAKGGQRRSKKYCQMGMSKIYACRRNRPACNRPVFRNWSFVELHLMRAGQIPLND